MKAYHDIFHDITQIENLFTAWEMFRKGKRDRFDVQEFDRDLERHVFALHTALQTRTYTHSPYHHFTICDPKQRSIHKATVRDRVVHQSVYSALNPIFEPTFFAHSYSCRRGKGTHRAVKKLHAWLRAASRNDHRVCFVLQCDIESFFASVAHTVLLDIMRRTIKDTSVLGLLSEIIGSFHSGRLAPTGPAGLPIGNLTSQLFANVYLNELDTFLKHELKVRYYIRYTDDFAIVSDSRKELESLIAPIRTFLQRSLLLELHPRKVTIRTFRQGIDFLGYVLLPHHRVLRTKTKRRMYRKLRERIASCHAGVLTEESVAQSLQSYVGILSHANSYDLKTELLNRYSFWMAG
jgi:RNA-directed DNA polymerase